MFSRSVIATMMGLLVMMAACGDSPSGTFEEDLVMGNWQGAFLQKDWKGRAVEAQVVAEGDARYRLAILVPVGAEETVKTTWLKGSTEGKKTAFEGQLDLGPKLGGTVDAKIRISNGTLSGKLFGDRAPGSFEMSRTVKRPSSLGAQAPQGAVVLFDGRSIDAWQPTKMPWAVVDGGAMEVRAGNIASKQEFGDCKIHIEFRTPLIPAARGQSRGNSGVYVQGRYEIQILDSFGLEARDNECGGIYKKATPKQNACLPPTEWQTYDITFSAPKFSNNGEKVKNAIITVELNGALIHDKFELDSCCPGGLSDKEVKTGPLMLQDHNSKVQFRNIWVQPL